jgi:integrase
VRFHDLQHRPVALLVAQRTHPLAVKERLRHSSITVTRDQYGHLLPTLDEALTDTLRDAAADFSRTNRGPTVPLDATQRAVQAR